MLQRRYRRITTKATKQERSEEPYVLVRTKNLKFECSLPKRVRWLKGLLWIAAGGGWLLEAFRRLWGAG